MIGARVANSNLELVQRLAHELGVTLEIAYDAVELKEVWTEAVEALEEAAETLKAAGMEVPKPAINVIKTARGE